MLFSGAFPLIAIIVGFAGTRTFLLLNEICVMMTLPFGIALIVWSRIQPREEKNEYLPDLDSYASRLSEFGRLQLERDKQTSTYHSEHYEDFWVTKDS